MTAYGALFVTLAAVLANWSEHVAEKEAVTAPVEIAATYPRWFLAVRLAGSLALVLIFVQGVAKPWKADQWCYEGEENLRSGDAIAALDCFRQAQEILPADLEIPSRCGQAAEQAGMTEPHPQRRQALCREALSAYDAAVQRVPQRADHHASRARILGQMAREGMADAKQAIAAYEQALQHDPNQVQFYVDASRVALECGDTAQAAEFAWRGLQRTPRYGPLHAQQAVIALRTGKVTEALTALNDLTQYQWDGAGESVQNARCAKAEALVRLGKHEEALRITRHLCRQRPDWSAPLYLEALALEGLGRWQEAAWHYEAILGREPHHGPAQRGLQRVRAQSRK
jgi:tetratricopeptide (TPR) repeat protein